MTQPKSFKVSQIANYLKELLEDDVLLSGFFIEGEISNFRLHSRGHMYFSIKDDRAAINSVMFAREAAGLDFAPAEGQRVLIYGRISHYAAGGATQLIAEIMNPLGIGEMHLAFVALKEKLEKEGIFANKRPLPEFPRAVAVVTSPTGAAIRDIITIMRRRNPLVAVFVVPALVQGVDAPRSIVAAIDLASKSGADALICGRGGGSAEDLAAFNTEAVARAVFGASIPVISAVGHETDFSLCDFAADIRAETPTAAAQMVCPDLNELAADIGDGFNRINRIMSRKIQMAGAALDNRLLHAGQLITGRIRNGRAELARKMEIIDKITPKKVLERGFAMVEKNGKPIHSANLLKTDDEIMIRFGDGAIFAVVKKIEG